MAGWGGGGLGWAEDDAGDEEDGFAVTVEGGGVGVDDEKGRVGDDGLALLHLGGAKSGVTGCGGIQQDGGSDGELDF